MDLKNKYIFDGMFGLERETLRVTAEGELAHTPHPFKDSRYLSRDFCENQLEIITPPCESISDMMNMLKELDNTARRELRKNNEYLWLNSNPPHINSEADIPIAEFVGIEAEKSIYRKKLEGKYGKRLMLYSGIHFNYSFSEELISSLNTENDEYKKFKSELYFKLSKQVFRYSWLPVLLTAASPDYDLSLDGDGLFGSAFSNLASLRNSRRGYWNRFMPILDYTGIESYVSSVNEYIKQGLLFSSAELYLPMRLKPKGNNSLCSLAENGVDHIELRMFDINPLAPLGIFEADLEFAHCFLLYLTQLPDFEFTPQLQISAIENHRAAAEYDIDNMIINGYPAIEAAMGLLDDMEEYFRDFKYAYSVIEKQKNKLLNNERYCVLVHERLNGDFENIMLEISKNGGEGNV